MLQTWIRLILGSHESTKDLALGLVHASTEVSVLVAKVYPDMPYPPALNAAQEGFSGKRTHVGRSA